MKHLGQLREQVAGAENRPGVYRLTGPTGEVLYVGKSIRVRGRLLSYFRADRGEKAREILGYARGVEWDYVPDEFAAVLHEFRLIRRLRPVFNVEHKRERAVCFIKIPREPAPRLLVTKRIIEDGAAYYGPLLGIGRVGEAVRDLANVLELRDCAASTPLRTADQGDLFGDAAAVYTPLCPRAELRRCLAPCAAGCTEGGYRRRVALAREFLEGRTDEPLERLRRRMHAAAGRLQFEYAAALRDRADRLASVRDALFRLREALADLEFVYGPPGHGGESRLYVLRSARVAAELPRPRTSRQRAAASRRIRAALAAPPPVMARLGADALAEMLLVVRWFRRRPEERRRSLDVESLLAACRGRPAGADAQL